MRKHIIIESTIVLIFIFITIYTMLIRGISRFEYKYDKDYDGYIITKAYGYDKKINIKKTYKGKNIVGIGIRAFYNNDSIVEVNFEDINNIKIIQRLAFYDCNNLKKIDLSNLDEIERNAFHNCTKLDNISLGSINIGASAFFGCKNLTNIELLDGIDNIGSLAFYDTKIKILDLPSSITELYIDAFKGMEELERIIVNNELLKENQYLKTLDIVEYR